MAPLVRCRSGVVRLGKEWAALSSLCALVRLQRRGCRTDGMPDVRGGEAVVGSLSGCPSLLALTAFAFALGALHSDFASREAGGVLVPSKDLTVPTRYFRGLRESSYLNPSMSTG